MEPVSFIIGIDTGGTFTDGYFIRDREARKAKVLTTPHDLTTCFLDCLREGAKLFSIPLEKLLRDTESIRYSTTIATNTVITKTGSKLGVIVTRGYENTLYRDPASPDPSPLDTFVKPSLVAPVNERIGDGGQEEQELDEEEALKAAERLIDAGARIVVALKNSDRNPAHELKIRQIIRDEYPRQYLGAVEVLLSHEAAATRNDFIRTNTAILNAYLHRNLAHYLYKAEDDLRASGYRWPLLVVSSHGGLSRVSKTKALQTYGSGPVAGILGALAVAHYYGYEDLVLTDMGGTSFDIGLIENGRIERAGQPRIEGIPIHLNSLAIESMGIGGGSIAEVDGNGRLKVGPRSAGALPGPACYDLGGGEPTVTDADVVLGYIDPNYFLGGRMKLNKERAYSAIEDRIARPLGLDVTEAAQAVRKVADAHMGQAVYKETALKGYDPKSLLLVAYGGAGPTHCCSFSQHLGIKRILTLPFSPVFCAFGGASMDILHTYEKGKRIVMSSPHGREYLKDCGEFNAVVEELRDRALRDMRGEGFGAEKVSFNLELDMKWGTQLNTTRMASPRLLLGDEDDVVEICKAFEEFYVRLYSRAAAYPEGGIEIESFLLQALLPTVKPQLPKYDLDGRDPIKALKGKREVSWEEGLRSTLVYERGLLRPGNEIQGPALIEAEDTTLVLPEDYRLKVDQHLSCVLER